MKPEVGLEVGPEVELEPEGGAEMVLPMELERLMELLIQELALTLVKILVNNNFALFVLSKTILPMSNKTIQIKLVSLQPLLKTVLMTSS